MPREPILTDPGAADPLSGPPKAHSVHDAEVVEVTERNRTRVFDVRDYGAVGDGVADDTAAINEAIAEWKLATTDTGSPAVTSGAALLIPEGRFRVNGTVDFTNHRSKAATIEAYGTIEAHTNGEPALDFTGSRFFRVFGTLRVSAPEEADAPSVGVLLARNSSGEAAGSHNFDSLIIEGFFTVAGYYCYASEEVRVGSAWVHNHADARSLFFGRTNIYNVTSPIVPIFVGANSMNGAYFGLLDARARGNPSEIVHIDGLNGLRMNAYMAFGPNTTGTKDGFIRVTGTTSVKAKWLDIFGHFECQPGHAEGIIAIERGGGPAGSLRRIFLTEHSPQANAYLFFVDNWNPVSGVVLEGVFDSVPPFKAGPGATDITLRSPQILGVTAGTIDLSMFNAVTGAIIQSRDHSDVDLGGTNFQGLRLSDTGVSMQRIGVNGEPPSPKANITGSTGGNAALQNLLAALETFGFITDNTS